MIDLTAAVYAVWESQLSASPSLGSGFTRTPSSPRAEVPGSSVNARSPHPRAGLGARKAVGDGARNKPALTDRAGMESANVLWRTSEVGRERETSQGFRASGGPVPRPDGRLTVRELPALDRPRERLAALGSRNLSSIELLACLLGRGGSGESVMTVAQRLLARFGSLERIAEASVEQLSQVHGVGLAKACQIKAAAEMGRRAELSGAETAAGRPLETVEAAGRAARRYLAGRQKEHFILLLLDSRHRVLRVAEISVGTLDMSVVHPRETFREAILGHAAAIILAHNHPSGDTTPSREDLDLTRRLTEAGRLMGIPVLDHLIVGAGRFLSLRSAGFMEES